MMNCVKLARFAIVAAMLGGVGYPKDSVAQKAYGPGVTDTEIKIGQTAPYSGPASAFSRLHKAEAFRIAWWRDQYQPLELRAYAIHVASKVQRYDMGARAPVESNARLIFSPCAMLSLGMAKVLLKCPGPDDCCDRLRRKGLGYDTCKGRELCTSMSSPAIGNSVALRNGALFCRSPFRAALRPFFIGCAFRDHRRQLPVRYQYASIGLSAGPARVLG
jgi:hypothetical protein